MDQSGTTQNRLSRRSNLLMQATLEIAGRALVVRLRNLSAEGARVEGEQLPIEGADLLFRKGELAIAARVIWSEGRQAGLRFERKLDPGVVLNHVPSPRAPAKIDFRRPGLTARDLTAVERTLGSQWFPIAPVPPGGD